MATRTDVEKFQAALMEPSDIKVVAHSREAYRLALEAYERESASYKALQDILGLLRGAREILSVNATVHAACRVEAVAEKAIASCAK